MGVLEGVGVVTLEGEALERSEGEVHGLAQVIHVVLVEVVRLQDHHETVHDFITVVLGPVNGGTVGVLGGIAGQGMTGALGEVVVDTALARIEVSAVEIAGIGADAQPVGNGEGNLGTQVHALVVVGVLLEHTLFVGVTAGDHVAERIRCAAHGDHVAGGRLNVVVQHMVPVGVGIVVIHVLAAGILRDHHPGTLGILHLVVTADPELLHVFVGVVGVLGTRAVGSPEQVVQVNRIVTTAFILGGSGGSGDAVTAAVAHLGTSVLLLGTALGGNQDDAGRTFSTVDGGGGSVLDHGNILHVNGVQVLDITFHTVDEHEGGTAVDGVPTTDVQRGGLAGTAGTGGDVKTGDGTLQHVAHIQGGTVLQGFGLHHGHGAGEGGLLGCTVSYDNRLFQHGGFGVHAYVHHGGAAYRHFLIGVTQGGDHQDGARLGLDAVVTVQVGGNAFRGAFDKNGSAGNGFAGSVGDLTADNALRGALLIGLGEDDHLAVKRHCDVLSEDGLKGLNHGGVLELRGHGGLFIHFVGTVENGEPGLGLDFLENLLRVLPAPLTGHVLCAGSEAGEQNQKNSQSSFG